MIKIISLLVLVALFLSTGICLAQQPTDWDVYCDFLETRNSDWEKEYETIEMEVANRHGISLDSLKAAVYKAGNKRITDWERKVSADLWDRLKNLPKPTTWNNDFSRIRLLLLLSLIRALLNVSSILGSWQHDFHYTFV